MHFGCVARIQMSIRFDRDFPASESVIAFLQRPDYVEGMGARTYKQTGHIATASSRNVSYKCLTGEQHRKAATVAFSGLSVFLLLSWKECRPDVGVN